MLKKIGVQRVQQRGGGWGYVGLSKKENLLAMNIINFKGAVAEHLKLLSNLNWLPCMEIAKAGLMKLKTTSTKTTKTQHNSSCSV